MWLPQKTAIRKNVRLMPIRSQRRLEFIRFFKKTGDIDFAISFLEGNETRTGLIRFKNNRSARSFYKRLVEYNPALFKSPVTIEVY